jgi:uncharacterized protein YaeQ
MQQLKDALVKAGLVTKEAAQDRKKRPKASKAPKKEFKKFNDDQIRTECELCNQNTPDIEYYRHNNRLIIKRWLCIKCADEHKIDDSIRETHQSSYARSGRFRRMWGRTKQFSKKS